VTRNFRVDWKPGGEIPATEVEGCAKDKIRDLGHDLGADKGKPVVRFRPLGQVNTLFFPGSLLSLHWY
jgi:hypothetical protein